MIHFSLYAFTALSVLGPEPFISILKLLFTLDLVFMETCHVEIDFCFIDFNFGR